MLWGVPYLWKIGVKYYLLEGVCLIIGCYFWEVGFRQLYPEGEDY